MQKTRHLADVYSDLLQQREEFRQAFLNRPVCTWDAAFTILTSTENNDAGRVQTSGTSDHTARIALNIDSVMERKNRDIVRAYLAPYQRVSDEIEMFELGINRLNGRTLCVARQLFVERRGGLSIGTLVCAARTQPRAGDHRRRGCRLDGMQAVRRIRVKTTVL